MSTFLMGTFFSGYKASILLRTMNESSQSVDLIGHSVLKILFLFSFVIRLFTVLVVNVYDLKT